MFVLTAFSTVYQSYRGVEKLLWSFKYQTLCSEYLKCCVSPWNTVWVGILNKYRTFGFYFPSNYFHAWLRKPFLTSNQGVKSFHFLGRDHIFLILVFSVSGTKRYLAPGRCSVNFGWTHEWVNKTKSCVVFNLIRLEFGSKAIRCWATMYQTLY